MNVQANPTKKLTWWTFYA